MTLLDAPAIDKARESRRRTVTLAVIAICVAVAAVVYLGWNIPAERRMDQFFDAVQSQDYPKAFAIWNNDPDWQKHPQKYAAAGYPYGRFLNDWSSSSDYGLIKTHKIIHATSRFGNNTLMAVQINDRAVPLTLGIEKKTHTFSFPPFALTPVKTMLGTTDWQIQYQ